MIAEKVTSLQDKMKRQNDNINMYENLDSYFLLEGVPGYFEVTDFAETPTKDKDVMSKTE